MLVSLFKKDIISICYNDDIERFKSDRENGNVKRETYLPSIRKTILANFEAFFGLNANDLIENYTCNGRKVDLRLLQRKVCDAVNALFLGKKEKDSHNIGEFVRARRGMSFSYMSKCYLKISGCRHELEEQESQSNLTLEMDSMDSALGDDTNSSRLLSLFTKKTVNMIRGDGQKCGYREYNSDLRKLTMKLVSHGISATSIKVVYDSIYDMFQSEMEKSEVPSRRWIQDQRDLIEPLVDSQIIEETNDAESLTIMHDGSTCNKDESKIVTVGVVNELNKFTAIHTKVVANGTADAAADAIISSLTRDVIEKADKCISDTAHTALRTSRLLDERMSEILDQSKETKKINCSFHTSSNMDKENDKANDPKIKQLFLDFQVLFSSRMNTGYRKEDLRIPLKDLLSTEDTFCKASSKRFLSKLGSRMATSANNALVALLHRKVILRLVVEEKLLRLSKINEKDDATRAIKRLERVESLLGDTKWPMTACQLGINTVMLNCITLKMNQLERNDLTVTQKKTTLRSIHNLYEQLLNSTDAYEELRKMSFQIADADFQDAMTVVDEAFEMIGSIERKTLSKQVKVGAQNGYKKLKKDQNRLLELPDSDELLLTTNRRAESVFATYKGLEKLFVAMTQERLEVLTRARVNKVFD